jgi:hypothetical protein
MGISCYRICKNCNKEYKVPLRFAGNATTDLICNFVDCPHCKKRDDVWVLIKTEDDVKNTPGHKSLPEYRSDAYLDIVVCDGSINGWSVPNVGLGKMRFTHKDHDDFLVDKGHSDHRYCQYGHILHWKKSQLLFRREL